MKFDKKILKSLLPGLLPLLVYVVADEIWGSLIGLYVAIGFGVLELIIAYIKFKTIEKFILLDIGLLVLLGSVSVLLENDIFFKLKPAFIELIFAAIIGFSVYSSRNIIFEMSKRYMGDVKVNAEAEYRLNKTLKVVLFLTLFHIALVVYSSFYMSKEAWAFISGVLYYLIILGYFGFEFFRNKRKSGNTETTEMLPIVDEEGNIIGKASRGECHFNPTKKLLHPVVHLHVFNNKGELYLQHRAVTKKVQPGKWDTAVGGHISYGEDLELSLRREAEEEIGISGFTPKLVRKYIWETDVERELVFMFVCSLVGELKPNPEEVSEGRFWTMNEIKQNLGKQVFTPNFEKEFLFLSGDKPVTTG
jgi:isopentenyldiphosphate isomerase/intracellular septation protein A